MTTPSQAAFESRRSGLILTKDYAGIYINIHTLKQFISWGAGVRYGRGIALEEAIAICNATCDPNNTEYGNWYNRAALDCEQKIKELLK